MATELEFDSGDTVLFELNLDEKTLKITNETRETCREMRLQGLQLGDGHDVTEARPYLCFDYSGECATMTGVDGGGGSALPGPPSGGKRPHKVVHIRLDEYGKGVTAKRLEDLTSKRHVAILSGSAQACDKLCAEPPA